MNGSQSFNIDRHGKCKSCSQAVVTAEVITCCSCSERFHAQCSAVDKANYLCTKTFLNLFLGASTKSNFKWFCDNCLTKFELSKVATVEDKYGELVTQISEIAKALNAVQNDVSEIKKSSADVVTKTTDSITTGCTHTKWSDQNRVQNMKASLVIKQSENGAPNINSLRELAVKNQIPVANVRVSKKGDTYIQCPTSKDRDKLQPLLQVDYGDKVNALTEKLPHISIVDIDKLDTHDTTESSKNDILSNIRSQNPEIANLISTGEEFTILFIKDGKSTNKCTAVARVSSRIRNLIKNNRNRLYIGINSCCVFDRFFVKRCNNCQEFGHYKDKCTNEVKCGHCGGDHQSDNCELKKDSTDPSLLSCCNCKASGLNDKGHSTFWNKCPAYVIAQKKLRSSIPYYDNLND